METIKFYIWRIGKDMCRITSGNVLTEVRKLTDGACICDMGCLMDELTRITKEVKRQFNAKAIFEFAEAEDSPIVHRTFNIGFTTENGPDETQFDIHGEEQTRLHETLFELFYAFVRENNFELKSVDYIEEVDREED